jgi:hypothetical protein
MPHDWTTKQATRQGLPTMSQAMMRVLYRLREAKQTEWHFIMIEDADPRTLRTLVRRDWIVCSQIQGIRYAITGRGLQALEVYEQPSHRFDGICPDCQKRPKMRYSTGTQAGYCKACIQVRQKQAYAEKGNQLNPEGLCAQCGKRQRHTYPSGYTIIYCAKCRTKRRKKERRQKHKSLLKRIKQGEFLPCYRCREKPRYHTANTVYDYCHDCCREYQNEYSRKREMKRALKKNGIPVQENL